MKTFLASLVAATAIVFAAPGYADDAVAEAGAAEASAVQAHEFIIALQQVGIAFDGPEQAIAAGKAVCGLVASGESGLELLTDIRNANPALTINDAARFAAIAANSYCPHQLTAAGTSK